VASMSRHVGLNLTRKGNLKDIHRLQARLYAAMVWISSFKQAEEYARVEKYGSSE